MIQVFAIGISNNNTGAADMNICMHISVYEQMDPHVALFYFCFSPLQVMLFISEHNNKN